MKHASIIPLIGGEAIASERAFGTPIDAIFTFEAFEANETHLLSWYKDRGIDVPYHVLDKRKPHIKKGTYKVVSSVCPCAGLSLFSMSAGANNPTNEWMIKAAEYVMGELGPEVYWGENAPALVGDMGAPIREKLIAIGKKYGYSASFFRTESLKHGVPQVRRRVFYFFWKGDKVPLLEYFNREYTKIEDVIMGARGNSLQEPINKKKPTDDPYYRYLLEVVKGGITHRQFFDSIDPDDISVRYYDAKSMIEQSGHTYDQVGKWMAKNGYPGEVDKCVRNAKKLGEGMNIMRRGTIVPKDHIGAFVGHYPMMLTHPHEDRYITYREALTIMGMPDDFQLLGPKGNHNHICQNVPVQTATDLAVEVKNVLDGKREYIDTSALIQYNSTQSYKNIEKSGGSTLF